MSTPAAPTQSPVDESEIRFNLRSVCTPEEIEKFKDNARKAGAKSLTDHFLNLTIRTAEQGKEVSQ